MNIQKLILDEIDFKGKDWDNFTKAFYTYVRLCKILTFDINYSYSFNDEEAKSIANSNENIDATNLESNRVICYGWSRIYKKILDELNIISEVTLCDKHEYVTIYDDNLIINADACHYLTSDLYRAKEGLQLRNFNRYYKSIADELYFEKKLINAITKTGYNKGIETIEVINMIKNELNLFKDDDNYQEHLMEAIRLILNCNKFKERSFHDGVNYVRFLLNTFTDRSSDKFIKVSDINLINSEKN